MLMQYDAMPRTHDTVLLEEAGRLRRETVAIAK
jgi:hypothetical protein